MSLVGWLVGWLELGGVVLFEGNLAKKWLEGGAKLWFRCDDTHCPVSRPVGGSGVDFHHNGIV